MTRLRGDGGALAPAIPVLAFVLLLLGGLIIDASRLLNARGRAVAYAEEAARAGASSILPGQSVLELDEPTVRARVQEYCDAILGDADQKGGVKECEFMPPLQEVADDDPRRLVVRVFVRLEIPASLLGMVGVETLEASGEGSSRPYEGVDPKDVDSSPPPVDVPVPDAPPGPPPGVGVPIVPIPSLPPLPTLAPGPSTSPLLTPSAQPTLPATPTASPAPTPTGPSPSPSRTTLPLFSPGPTAGPAG